MTRIVLTFFIFLLAAACDETKPGEKESAGQGVVHLCQWAENFDPHIIRQFEEETGIRVVLDEIDSNEGLEARLLAGNSGYDLVFPSMIPHFLRQKEAGIFAPFDRSKLPNMKHLDMELNRFLTGMDPDGVLYGLPYVWGTTGLAYNIPKVRAIFPDLPLDSWNLVFDPALVSCLTPCGVALQDSAVEVFPAIQFYLGLDHRSEDPQVLRKTGDVFAAIRPFVRKFQGMQSLEDLARGDVCVAQVWSGEALRASQWARGLGQNVEIGYIIPREGAVVWADMMAVLADAPHKEAAWTFLNFLMKPEVMARNSLYLQCPTIGRTARTLLPKAFLDNPMIYPSKAVMLRLHRDAIHSPDHDIRSTRLLTRIILLNPEKKKPHTGSRG